MSLYQRLMARGEYPYRPRPTPPPVDLVRESEHRTARAAQVTDAAFGPDAYERGVAYQWPDPYGPDPIVFGIAPRVKSPFSD